MVEESSPPSPARKEFLGAASERAVQADAELVTSLPDHCTEPPFLCECDAEARAPCKDEPFYKKRHGKRYCVLHYPGKEQSAAFGEALEKKIEANNFDFCP